MWQAASSQAFYSIGVASGTMIILASYNPFRHPLYRDTVIVCTLDTLTSLLAGAVIFAVLGYMAAQKNVPIADVATGGTKCTPPLLQLSLNSEHSSCGSIRRAGPRISGVPRGDNAPALAAALVGALFRDDVHAGLRHRGIQY